MGPLRAVVVVAAALALLLAFLACNKGAAEESLQEAESAIEEARGQLERYAPEELAALDETVREARADVDAGEYTRALRAAQELPGRIRSAQTTADKRKAALGAEWDELSPGVERLIERLRARVGRLPAAGARATGRSPGARMPEARTELRAIVDAWEEATVAHQKGNLSRAVRAARDVHARALAAVVALKTAPGTAGVGDRTAVE